MKLISLANKKGGIGKTTIAKNLAVGLIKQKYKVLVIDLDPQANLSEQLAKDNIDPNKSLYFLAENPSTKIEKIIQKTKYTGLNIITSSHQLDNLSEKIFSKEQEYTIKYATSFFIKYSEVLFSYDFIIIDYPPSLSTLNKGFLAISDIILAPTNDGRGGLKGLIDLRNTINKERATLQLHNPQIFKIILNNVKNSASLDEANKFLEKEFSTQTNINPNILFSLPIYESSSIKENENKFSTIWENRFQWRQKRIFKSLINEIIKELNR